jgi:hypothetical protein
MKTKKKVKPRGVRLNKPQDVRRLLSRLINQAMRGEIDVDLLRAVTYASSMILKSLEVGELSDRLGEIEKRYMS